MTNYSDLIGLLRNGQSHIMSEAADALEAQAKRIQELEAEKQFILIENERRWEKSIPSFHNMEKLVKELEAFRKKELDFYLWDKKRMSRCIAGLKATLRIILHYADDPKNNDYLRETVLIPVMVIRQVTESLKDDGDE